MLSFDGPFRIEPEDLQPDLASRVLNPRWLVEITVPIVASEIAWTTALRVGRHLADEMAGVLFDPQEDAILWPRSKQRRMTRLQGASVHDVEIEWAIPAGSFNDSLSKDLLDMFKRVLPEALPHRYGAFEPLQHRFAEGEEQFHSLWSQEAAAAGLGLFWSAAAPVRAGSVFFPGSMPPGDGVSAGSIQLEIDGRVFESNHWRDFSATLLDRVGGLIGAFCGRAVVIRRQPGGIPASEVNRLAPAMVWGGAWLGLPDHPAWLTWLSPAYARLLLDSEWAGSMRDQANGSVVSLSETPKSAEELLPWHDRFPLEFCRLPTSPEPDRANHLERLGSPTEEADAIPFAVG